MIKVLFAAIHTTTCVILSVYANALVVVTRVIPPNDPANALRVTGVTTHAVVGPY